MGRGGLKKGQLDAGLSDAVVEVLGGTISARTLRAPIENARAHDANAMDRLAGRHQVAVLAAHG